MLLRQPRIAEPFHAPPEFLCTAGAAWAALPLGGRVRPRTLRAFANAMARHGLAVQSARMGYDLRYARERLACAHAAGDGALRALAVELFEAFQRA